MDRKSGQEVAKHNEAEDKHSSRFHVGYWKTRLFKKPYRNFGRGGPFSIERETLTMVGMSTTDSIREHFHQTDLAKPNAKPARTQNGSMQDG